MEVLNGGVVDVCVVLTGIGLASRVGGDGIVIIRVFSFGSLSVLSLVSFRMR